MIFPELSWQSKGHEQVREKTLSSYTDTINQRGMKVMICHLPDTKIIFTTIKADMMLTVNEVSLSAKFEYYVKGNCLRLESRKEI